MTRSNHPARRLGLPELAILLAIAMLAPPFATRVSADEPRAVVEFEVEPYRVPSLGLSVSLPVDSQVRTTWAGPNATIRVSDGGGLWIVTVNQGAMPEGVTLKQFLERLAARAGVTGARGRDRTTLLSHDAGLQVDGRPAERIYLRQPEIRGEAPVVQAYTVVEGHNDKLLTFTLVTTESALETAKVAYEGMLKSCTLTDPTAEAASRQTALDATARLLNAGQPKWLDPLVGLDRWYRLYQPSPTDLDADAVEHGYRHVKLARGGRGAIDPVPTHLTAREMAEGYLLTVDSRLLLDGQVVDSVGHYFLSADGSEEAWRVDMTVADSGRRSRGQPQQWTEIGERSGSTLTVTTRGGNAPIEPSEVTVPPTGYLSQIESLLWPDLLASVNPSPGAYASYAYRPQRGAITLRLDDLDQPADKPNLWRLTSTPDQGGEGTVTLLTTDGRPISATLASGQVWKPIDRARLEAIWNRKGLDLD